MVMSLGVFLAVALWGWDFAIDPVGAPNALPYRLAEIPALGLFALYLYFNLWPQYRTFAFALTMIASQALLYPILAQLDTGPLLGFGAHLFWLIFLPLVGIGLTLKDCLYGILVLSTAPLLWNALGLLNNFQVDVFVFYMWPAGMVVSIILVFNNQFLLQMIRNQKALSVARDQAEQLARTDSLTGLNNRRAFFDLGNTAFQNARRYKHPLSVVLLDLDKFKNINDVYGHAVGDSVIKRTADLISSSLRETDITGRLGGEEFALILNETNGEQAMELAERLRLEIANSPLDAVEHFSGSLGVAEQEESCQSLDDLIALADEALYAAKQQGRDRVILYNR